MQIPQAAPIQAVRPDGSPAGGTWRHRLAVATVAMAVPLLLFGGTVTTLEAGMAIDGWWVLEPGRGDHFLLFYPVEKWFRDVGTFVEHTHRLFGTLVGMLSIATCVLTLRGDPRLSARLLSVFALVAVCAQGALGGFRVLENSPELAFMHGAFAQLVFAILAGNAVFLSPRWQRHGPAGELGVEGEAPISASRVAVVLVYATIFLGAWLRHASSHVALALHIVLALASAALVLSLAARLRRMGESSPGAQPLVKLAGRLFLLLSAQVLLGLASFWIVFVTVGPGVGEVHHSVFPTLHVLTGALLLAQLVAGSMWCQRIAGAGSAR